MRFAQRPRPPASLRLTAMVDVVFLLVIFFMTVSQLNREVNEPLPLPEAEAGEAITDREGRLVLNLRQDGSIAAGGREIASDEVVALLHKAVEREGADTLRCVLRVDRRTRFATVRAVLAQVAHAGVWHISYSVLRPGTEVAVP